MANAWDADNELSPAQAAHLIDRQFPSLAPAQVGPLGVGWDNIALVVNGRYVFRFPRRKFGADVMGVETRWLPRLAPLLPAAIPAPAFAGEPGGDYPYPFAGYPIIEGVTACRADLYSVDRTALARPLAEFLRALHEIDVDPATRAEAPTDTIRRADVRMRAPHVKRDIAVPAVDTELDPEIVGALVDELSLAEPATQTCWVHGDLYARHLMVSGGALSGVIDWGDLHIGDPALDLSIAYSFLTGDSRVTFFDTYGPVDRDTHRRARFRSLHYAAVLFPYGRDRGDDAILQVARDALTFAIDT